MWFGSYTNSGPSTKRDSRSKLSVAKYGCAVQLPSFEFGVRLGDHCDIIQDVSVRGPSSVVTS